MKTQQYTIVILIISLLSYININAQGGDDPQEELMPYQNIIPPGPNAASLGKYGETPVSLFNGKPNISIPLWEIKTKSFTVPISLSYDAGGLKVAEIPSWVGAGWSLSAGGVITRVIRGIQDDKYGSTNNGYMFADAIPNSDYFYNNNDIEHTTELRRIIAGLSDDYQYDDFYFNFTQHSGKFHVKPNQIPTGEFQSLDFITIPYQKIKIEYLYDYADYRIGEIKVTTPDGIQYFFGNPEYTSTISENTADIDAVNSWYLTKIVGLNEDIVLFEYDDFDSIVRRAPGIVFQQRIGTCNAEGVQAYNYLRQNTSYVFTQSPRLSKIIAPDQIIIFKEYDTYREDIFNLKIPGSTGENYHSYALEEIKIYERDGDETEPLSENYFKSFVFYSGNTIGNSRLTLNALQEKNDTTEMPPYLFYYHNSENFPPINTNLKQDYWGFYKQNDISTDEDNYLPKIDFVNGNSHIYYNENASDKLTDISSIRNGTLEKITYPTKGYTEFEYGINYIDNFSYNSGISVIGESGTSSGTAYSISVANGTNSTSFTVPETGTYTISYSFNGDGGGGGGGGGSSSKEGGGDNHYISIDGVHLISYGTIEAGENYSGTYSKYFTAGGSHSVTVSSSSSAVVSSYMSYSYTTPGENFTAKVEDNIAGGIRIQKISDYSENGKLAMKREYDYHNSGKIFAIPIWFREYERMIYLNGLPTGTTCDFLQIHSSNLAYSGIIQGSPVGYTQVSEKKISDDGTMKTVKFFNNITEAEYDDYPFRPVSQRNLGLVGKIDKEEFWSFGSKVKEVTYDYYNTYRDGIQGLVAGEIIGVVNAQDYQTFNIGELFKIKDYYSNSYMDNIKSKDVTDFFDGNELLITTDYEYNDYGFPSKIIINDVNNNEETTVEKWYPFNSLSSEIPADMTDKWILSPVTEQKVTVNSTPADWQIVDYSKYFNKFCLPNSIRKLDIKSGEPYTHTYFNEYDTYGNIVEYQKKDDYVTTILWGYDYSKVIAKIENKNYSQVISALSLSYEDLQTKTDIELETIINDLRNNENMKDALITSYKYDAALKKMTTQTDPNGNTNYYEYDDFGRLKLLKDQDGNIIKTFDYHYKQN